METRNTHFVAYVQYMDIQHMYTNTQPEIQYHSRVKIIATQTRTTTLIATNVCLGTSASHPQSFTNTHSLVTINIRYVLMADRGAKKYIY